MKLTVNRWPVPAGEVDRLSYGDCNGLINYTQSLLNAAGAIPKAEKFLRLLITAE